MVWYQRNYTMPYISKNVWCQAHYIQQHHQEERERILGGCFLCFQFTFTAETGFENSYEDFIYWETAVFCSWRWWEYNFSWSWKSGQTLGFIKEKGENQGLVLRTAELIQFQTHIPWKGEKIRFQPLQDKDCSAHSSQGFIGVLWEQRNAVGFGYQNPSNSWSLWMLTAWTSSLLGEPWGVLKPLWANYHRLQWSTGHVAAGNLTESEAFNNCSTSLKRRSLLILT